MLRVERLDLPAHRPLRVVGPEVGVRLLVQVGEVRGAELLEALRLEAVGRDLGVRYVLEGSVRKAGERVRISGNDGAILLVEPIALIADKGTAEGEAPA